jgi:hypothetical protein
MNTLAEKSHVVQNMGLIDRLLRLLVGVALLSVSYYYAVHSGVKYEIFEFSVFAIALYPIFTGMFGWDPAYAMFHARTCGDSGRNQCGTLPYELKAAVGRAPKYCEGETEHSLESCHDESEDRPRHKVWKVDMDPILYPDDRDWKEYMHRNDAGHNKA